MKQISEIDPNLEVKDVVEKNDIEWISAADKRFRVEGFVSSCVYEKPKPEYIRLPYSTVQDLNDGMKYLSLNTAGGCVRFKTDSPYICIHSESRSLCIMSHMPMSGIAGFDLYTDNNTEFVKTFLPPVSLSYGPLAFEGEHSFGSSKLRDITINFPLYNRVDVLNIGLKAGSRILPADGYANDKPVVYYGSSITQGACASHPGNSYEGFVSRALNLGQINLGFSGNCKGEKVIAEYLAKLPMAAFVFDYDFNAPSPEHLRQTHYPFYKIIREAQPELPIICMSRAHDPDGDDSAARREVIEDTVHRAKAEGDRNIYMLDGRGLFDGDFADCCTVDTVHPNDLGFYRMAQALIPVLENVLGIKRRI